MRTNDATLRNNYSARLCRKAPRQPRAYCRLGAGNRRGAMAQSQTTAGAVCQRPGLQEWGCCFPPAARPLQIRYQGEVRQRHPNR